MGSPARQLTGKELRRLRRDKLRLTQQELGEEIGVTRGTVLLYEHGRLKITRAVELAVLCLVEHGS